MRRLVANVVVSSLLCSAPALTFAQEPAEPAEPVNQEEEEFKRYTAEAAQAYETGDYAKAVELFEKAYEIRPVSNILYNIARIHEEAGNIDGAIAYYDRFVVAPGVEQNARKDAVDRLKTLREVQAVKEGEPREETDVVVVEETPPPPEPEPTPPQPNTAATLGWVFVGVGGASLVTSGIFGLLAQGNFNDFENATSLEERRSAANAGRTQAVIADSLLVTGIVTGIVGGVVLVASAGGAEKPATASSSWSVSPLVGQKSVGMGFELNF